MMRRLLTIVCLLTCSLALHAGSADKEEAAEAALADIDRQIEAARQEGDVSKESDARWKKIVTLKNYSLTEQMADEASVQMEWFKKHDQWNMYYRAWQLKANTLCSLGKLQPALQETQRMLNDAKERGNTMGHALAYKQISVIYLNMKQTEPAVEAMQRYAELMGEEGDINSLSNIYYRMAKAYDYDKAYEQELRVTDEWYRFLQARVGKQKVPEVRECYHALHLAKAAAFIGLKRYEEARLTLDTASHHAHLIKTSLALHHYYKMQARYHLASGDAVKALLYTDSVRVVTDDKDDHTDEVRAQALLMLGNGAEAASIYRRLYHDKDSVFSHEARQHLDELNTLFQVDELKTEQQRTKMLYMFIAVVTVILALLAFLYYGWRTAIKERKANEELRIANERAKVSSRMKSEFVRNITHEIRTPLNIVSGFTQILTSDMDLPKDEKQDIQQRIAENTDRITKLVDRMLELSDASSEAVIECSDRIDAQTIAMQAVDYSRIALHTLPENTSSSVRFDYQPSSDGTVMLLTNKIYAVRALAQLLENAAKFTSDGTIRLYTEPTDNAVRFVVEDTGIGVPIDKAEQIFGEFVQLDSFADGTGIGLTVARSLARRMGGDLWIDTNYTKGSRFILELCKANVNSEDEKSE